MKLLHGADKYFIGAVKFFDETKGFGFIASNNCNMDSSEYYQDFYITILRLFFVSLLTAPRSQVFNPLKI